MNRPYVRNTGLLVLSIIICNGAGILGSLVTSTGPGSWYDEIAKPPFTPPSWIFAPAWITLYTLMGISLYLIWMEITSPPFQEGKKKKQAQTALLLFAGQLFLNVLWSFIFFGMQSPLYGLIEIILLWLVIMATMIAFWRIKKTAALLLIPYLLWVTFAATLTYSIFILNP